MISPVCDSSFAWFSCHGCVFEQESKYFGLFGDVRIERCNDVRSISNGPNREKVGHSNGFHLKWGGVIFMQ